MARYGKKAQDSVKKAMKKKKKGTLKSGRSGKKVKSRKQAIAIGLSEARQAGAKVPKKKAAGQAKAAKKKTAQKKTSTKKTSKKKTAKSSTRKEAAPGKKTTKKKSRAKAQ